MIRLLRWCGVTALTFLALMGAGVVQAVQGDAATHVVASTTELMRAELARLPVDEQTELRQLQGLIERHVGLHIDFDRVAKWVVGKPWKSTTAEQREAFVVELRKMMFRTYSQALTGLEEADIEYGEPKLSKSGKGAVVRSTVKRPGGGPLAMNYYLLKRDDTWRLYDISVAGVRMLSTYKASFKERVRQAGMDGLIQHLVAVNTRNAN